MDQEKLKEIKYVQVTDDALLDNIINGAPFYKKKKCNHIWVKGQEKVTICQNFHVN